MSIFIDYSSRLLHKIKAVMKHHRLSSEKRDSNPRPQPWEGCALPTELLSHYHQTTFWYLQTYPRLRLYASLPGGRLCSTN